jgi:hypothetical protein
MESVPLVDCAGRRRSPATLPSFHQGRAPRNKGLRYPPDPPTVEEIVAVMRAAGNDPEGIRLRGVIVVLWRAGLRISEALALTESDLDRSRGAVLVRRGKGGICRKQHMPPYVALGTMLRWVVSGRLFVGIGLVGATYFGRVRGLSKDASSWVGWPVATGLVFGGVVRSSARRWSRHVRADVFVGAVERLVARIDRNPNRRPERPKYVALAFSEVWRCLPPAPSRSPALRQRNIVLGAT